jgi:hypothetical protein
MGSAVLDCMNGYSPAPAFQQNESDQCLRFFDSQHNYTETEQDTLIQALAQSPVPERVIFFEGVLACRRRVRTKWMHTALRRVLHTADHYHLLTMRALVFRIRRAMHARGLLAADAFRAFDHQVSNNKKMLMPVS